MDRQNLSDARVVVENEGARLCRIEVHDDGSMEVGHARQARPTNGRSQEERDKRRHPCKQAVGDFDLDGMPEVPT